MATESLTERMATDKHKGFRKVPQYFSTGDYITYFDSEERCYARRVNDLLTIYEGIETGNLVGCQIKGITELLKRYDAVTVGIESETLNMAFLFMNLSREAKAEELPQVIKAGNKFANAPIPQSAMSCAAA